MKSKRHTEKYSPKHNAPSSENKERYCDNNQRHVIVAIDPDVVAILNRLRSVTFEGGLVVFLCRAAQNPTDVCPPTAIAGRMRIPGAIGVRMMYAVRHYPLNRSTFKRERAARN